MKIPLVQLTRARKLENSIFILIVLFVFKVIFPTIDSLLTLAINETLVILSIYFLLLYAIEFIHDKIVSPLSLVLNIGILNAVLFFLVALSMALFEDNLNLSEGTDFIITILISLVAFVFICSITYIFSGFRELFLLHQKKDPTTYFNVMLVFIFLAALFSSINEIDPSLEYIFSAFYVISIILISINSLRVAWIAFLVKKQKLYLLLISIVLSALFAFNFALLSRDSFIIQVLIGFSPVLQTFLNLTMLYGFISFGVIFFTTLFHLPTAEAFDRKAEEASSLMDLSKLITQVFDFRELADTITKMTTKVSASNSAWLITSNKNTLELTSIHNIGYLEADKLIDTIDLENFGNLDKVKVFNSRDLAFRETGDYKLFKSIAVAPLHVHNVLSGYLFSARKQGYAFDDEDNKTIRAFADYAAVALENAKLFKESIEKERLEKELDVAREIQYKILPSSTPECENLKISTLFIPAFEVGGDYYDFFKIEEGKLGFVIADVSGKGITAAFIMAEVKGIFESLSKLIKSPKELLIKVNEALKNSLDSKTFVTAVYGIFDITNKKLIFARAGHSPVHLLRSGDIQRLAPSGIGLGLDYSSKFCDTLCEVEITLNDNDILLLYTDGIPEAQNGYQEDFGYDRLDNILLNNSEKPNEEISNEIMKEISLFSKNNEQHDDITLIIFKWKF